VWGEIAHQDENAPLMQRMENSGLRQLRRVRNMLFKVGDDALALRDVKNEGTSGDVHENKGEVDKMSIEKHAFYTKTHRLHDD